MSLATDGQDGNGFNFEKKKEANFFKFVASVLVYDKGTLF